MKNLVISFIMLLATAVTTTATATQPDFAYPKQVSAQAEKDLKKAISGNDSQALVNAIIRYGLAQTMVSNDNFPTVIAKTESLIDTEKSPVTRSLLCLLAADLYNSYYNLDRYNLDRRTSVDNPGNDITLWSGAQLKDKIRSLYVDALRDSDILKTAPLADYADIITADKTTLIFYPTLFDFASQRALANWPAITKSNILPWKILFTAGVFRTPAALGQSAQQLIAIADNWVNAYPDPSAPRIEALIQRFDAIEGHVINTDDSDEIYFNNLVDLYRDNSASPYSVEILMKAIGDYTYPYDNIERCRKSYDLLRQFATANPAYFRIAAVNNLLKKLTQADVNISGSRQAAKGIPFTINVRLTNINEAEILVYSLPDSYTAKNNATVTARQIEKLTPIDRIKVTADGDIPFKTSTAAQYTFSEYGNYTFVPATTAKTSGTSSYLVVTCTDIALISITKDFGLTAWSLDLTSGSPLEGIDMNLSQDQKGKTILVGHKVTDKNGSASFTGSKGNARLSATHGNDKYAMPINLWLYETQTSTSTAADVKTSLPVYHPGDTAEFVAVVYNYDSREHHVIPSTPVKAILRDANMQPRDTLDLTTDSFGRATSRFALPKGGLTGNFSIVITKPGDNKNDITIGSNWFLVSDYKLPTYTVTIDSISTPDDTQRSVTIHGSAMTYSGFPVSDATVKLSLSAFQWCFWNRSTSDEFYETETTTSADGSFTIVLDDNVLSLSPLPDGALTAKVSVTSPSGENREASKDFALGNGITIDLSLPSAVNATTPRSLPIAVKNVLGKDITADVSLIFRRTGSNDSISVSTTSVDGEAAVDLTKIPSGTYSLRVTSPGAESSGVSSLIIYRPDDRVSPTDKPLWLPTGDVTATAETRKASILYATESADTPVLLLLYSTDGLISQEWIKHRAGMNTAEITLPAGINEARALFINVNNGNIINKTASIKISDPSKELKVTVERFRDRIAPETEETVSIKVTDGNGNPSSAAVILDMYSKALDAIAQSSWEFTPRIGYRSWPDFSTFNSNQWYSQLRGILDNEGVTTINTPEFNLYGMAFGAPIETKLYIRGTGATYRASAADYAMPMMAKANSNSLEEVVVAKYAETTEDEESGEEISSENGESIPAEKDFSYRPSEIALAFFKPSLSTDADGRLTYSFTVPNANTTWTFNALAFTEDLKTATVIREAVAAKPVMVEPNLPRFIRHGDKAVILASVMNNTDSTATVTTTFEILNPTDMSVIANGQQTDTIEGRSSSIASFDITGADNLSAVIVRVKSSTATHSDGEQTLLPVLEASQPVIDATTFYLSTDQKSFITELPADNAEATTEISFCENPTWEVVSALPGLRADLGNTSLSAAAALFSAAIARGILDSNPTIEPALKEWLNSAKDDATLLSMLNRNEDLKQLMLASTPWVEEAESDNDRMTRLALLFDAKETSAAIDKAIDALSRFERGNGGWGWSSSAEKASSWATFHVLHELGHLNTLGWLPSDKRLDEMMRRALAYLDGEIASTYRKSPKSTFIDYVYMRGMFPKVGRSTGAQAATNATIQSIVKNWKNYTPTLKAGAAIILHRDKYPTLAKSLIASLREFAESTPQQGMWWPSINGSSWWSLTANAQTAIILDAFNLVEPGSADVDAIRQWLILNKQVQDWGNSVNTSAIVASILNCGSSWLNRPGDVTITIDGTTLNPTEADKLTGKFITTIEGGKELRITRTNEGPAWGAVISRYTAAMTDIKANSLPELSISKETLVKRENGWTVADSLSVGDVAKVRLVINATRNMDYITIVDQRAACLEPVVQTPRNVYSDGLYLYLENRDAQTNLFVDRMPAGQYIVEYEMNVNNAGTYSSGIATIQSQYTPEMTAHSAGMTITVMP